MLRAPDLKILSAEASKSRAAVGEMISVTVKLQNVGNIHATDVSVILCADQTSSDIRKNGCDEDNIVYRQMIEAVMPVSQSNNQELLEISLLYIVEAGSQDIVVYVDPDNDIIESEEANNYYKHKRQDGVKQPIPRPASTGSCNLLRASDHHRCYHCPGCSGGDCHMGSQDRSHERVCREEEHDDLHRRRYGVLADKPPW